MGYWIAMAVNPNPTTDTADRQWAALNQAGMIMTSHGIAVPTDTPNQPNRGYASGSPGNFTVPRFGWPAAYLPGYVADVARDIVVTDWTPDDLSGYVMDSYGSLWPFGQKTPVAATGIGGAPFGIFPLGPGVTVFNGFQMHSANGKPFGLGGFADGFGWMISADGIIVNWLGPITDLAQPWQNLGGVGLSGDGVLRGGQRDCVRDFKVNPDGSGDYYVLMQSGYVFNGGPPNRVVVAGDQPSPANVAMDTPNGFRWMHVEWGKWIIAFRSNGDPWGYNITGTTETVPPLPFSGSPPHAPWYNATGGPPPGTEGFWQDGELIPARGPTHLWMNASTGLVGNQSIVGALSISGLTVSGTNTTTTQPTLSWTYTETLQVPQTAYSVRVYKQSYINAQGGAFVPGQIAGTADGWINDRNSATPNDKINRNLENGVVYRAYVRVRSAANVWTNWTDAGATLQFTMSIPVPATPSSCSTTLHPGAFPNLGTIDITAGGGLGAGETREFQVSAGGADFVDVWGAESTTNATVTDKFPPTNVSLTYRVRAVKRVPGVIASGWRTAAPVVLPSATGTPGGWRFIDVGPSGLGPTVILELQVAASSFDGQKPQGEFQPMTQMAKTVTTMGRKGDDHTVTLHAWDQATYQALYKMLSLTRPILFQNIYGRQWWVAASAGTWKTLQLLALATETTGIRDAHDVDLHLVQVNPPR